MFRDGVVPSQFNGWILLVIYCIKVCLLLFTILEFFNLVKSMCFLVFSDRLTALVYIQR
jgi:hypothetical protein